MKETLADIAWAINVHTITEHQNMPCQGGSEKTGLVRR